MLISRNSYSLIFCVGADGLRDRAFRRAKTSHQLYHHYFPITKTSIGITNYPIHIPQGGIIIPKWAKVSLVDFTRFWAWTDMSTKFNMEQPAHHLSQVLFHTRVYLELLLLGFILFCHGSSTSSQRFYL